MGGDGCNRGIERSETIEQDERLRGGDVADGALVEAPGRVNVGRVEEGAAKVEAGVGEDLERRVGEEEAAVLVFCVSSWMNVWMYQEICK